MTFKDICDNAGIDTRSYSGRGAYGAKCLGIVTANMLETIADLIVAADYSKEAEMVADALRHARTDNMGLDTILYFPPISYTE